MHSTCLEINKDNVKQKLILLLFLNEIVFSDIKLGMNKKCIILTGGGTAGHVTVNINLQNELKKHFDKVIYIGSENGIEKKLIQNQTPFTYTSIPTVKLVRRKVFKNLAIPFKLLKAVKEAKTILEKEQPCVIFSKGGYVGLPVVIAAKKLNIPVVCHESDFTMGLANKIAKKYANVICTNFESTAIKNGKKCVWTGMPLPMSNLSKNEAKEKLNIKTNKPVLLVTGGSLGAKALNEFVFKNIHELTKEYFVIHLVGKNNLNKNLILNNYMQIEFSNDMKTIFKATDYAISRAGANTIFELLSNKILSIFVPLPKKVSRGDQIENALYLDKQGCAKALFQEDLTLKKVQNYLNFLKNNANIIKNQINFANFNDGTKKIMDIILQQKNT